MIKLLLLIVVFSTSFTAQAAVQRITLSERIIEKDYKFKGKIIEIAGEATNINNLIIKVTGPTANYQISKKEKFYGLWSNHNKVTLKDAYSFFFIASSKDYFSYDIANNPFEVMSVLNLFAERNKCTILDTVINRGIKDDYCQQFVNNMVNKGLYVNLSGKIVIDQERYYKIFLYIPSDIKGGDYVVAVYDIDQNGLLQSQAVSKFTVIADGFYGKLRNFAYSFSIAYSLLSISIAVMFGAIAGLLFKKPLRKK